MSEGSSDDVAASLAGSVNVHLAAECNEALRGSRPESENVTAAILNIFALPVVTVGAVLARPECVRPGTSPR